jgi:hypothetical protein
MDPNSQPAITDARARAEALRRQAAAIEAAIADEGLAALVEAHNEARRTAARAAERAAKAAETARAARAEANAARDALVVALRRHIGVAPRLLAELTGAPEHLVAAAAKQTGEPAETAAEPPAEPPAEPVEFVQPVPPFRSFGVGQIV